VALRAAIARARRVVVLGAGFIGCEVAATLRTAGVAVTLVDVLAHPLAPLGAALGEVCAGLHLAHGVELRLGRRVAALEGDGRLTGVRLQDGERIAADVAVVALGAAPAVGWLEASGLAGRDGVPVDRHCFADEARRIVCAGDAAVFPHPLVDSGPVAIRHWSNAAEQAPVAAANLLAAPGERRAYAPVPSFWSDQYDVRIQSVGFPALADRVEIVDGSPQEGRLLAVAERGGRLIGAVAFNSARRLVEYRRALADSVAATAVGS
jgi:NADPH-dependent 2,4-dienoyl-CoA reductase/sulfur reductase-like enzyme